MLLRTGTVFCAALLLGGYPAFAGFEFTPAAPAAKTPVPRTDVSAGPLTPEPSGGAGAMPALALPDVVSEPLAPPVEDKVLSRHMSREESGALRINPQPLAKRIPAPAGRPFDGDALLDATILGAPLSLPEAPAALPAAPRREIEINPFPLRSGAALHGDNRPAMDRGMMEETAMLRPVAVPGGRIPAEQPVPPAPAQEAFYPADNVIESEPLPLPLRKPDMAVPAFPPSQGQSFAEAVGFGRDLPLALALSQVVPPDYSYSFSQNVDAGTNVSWQGGKPWDQVLNDMLAPSGLRADIRGRDVMIKSINS